MSYFDISGAVFNNQLRELETSDPAHADVFNAVFRQLINNDVALMEAASMFAGEKNKQAEFILNLKRTGKKYGVHHSAFDVSPLSAGTRTLDAVGMVAQPSTNTVRGRNDFEGESVFYGLEVNGHVDDAGEFIVEYIKGIDNEFSRTERDTWMLYLTQWINITIDANGESLVISDEHHAGFFPEGAAIRTDQTVRPFVAQAKYMAGNGSDGKAASISGVNAAHDQSHNGMITRFKAKGTQYCGTTAQDKNHMDNLFEVAFATRNSQSIMGLVFHGQNLIKRCYSGKTVTIRNVSTRIRASIFLKARRKIHRFAKKIKNKKIIGSKFAMSTIAYNGWFVTTDSFLVRVAECWDQLISMAKNIISRYAKQKSYAMEKYYKKWRKLNYA